MTNESSILVYGLFFVDKEIKYLYNIFEIKNKGVIIMNIVITGKELKATEAIKEYVGKKLERIERYFEGEEIDVSVKIKAEKNSQIAEMQVNVKGYNIRAVTETKDLYASIDKNIDILEGQIRKIKTKKEKMNKDESIRLKESASLEGVSVVENEVIKTLYYDIKPISVEDAKLKLEEKVGNIFLTFVNVDTGKVNVLFKLKDSENYGIVEPEV